MRFVLTLVCLCVLSLTGASQKEAETNDYTRLDYWVDRYGVASNNDPLVTTARDVFGKLCSVSEKPINTTPALYIIRDTVGLKAFSLPNGPIILNYQVLKFCNAVPREYESRLAFILAHEISHEVNGDFWHVNFFSEISKNTSASPDIVLRLRNLARKNAELEAKELRADHYAILYMVLAGLPISSVQSEQNNIFIDWYASSGLDVQGYTDGLSPKERIEVVKTKLNFLYDELDTFRDALYLLRSNRFREGATLLESFKANFPSHEVLNDLGVAYFLLAQELGQELGADHDLDSIPLIRSVQLDPLARLKPPLVLRGSTTQTRQKFALRNHAIAESISNLEECVRINSDYGTGYLNLACVLDYAGRSYEAIGKCDLGLKVSPRSALILNARGVALSHIEEQPYSKAIHDFRSAIAIDSSYWPAIVNIGLLYKKMGQNDSARSYLSRIHLLNADRAWQLYIASVLGNRKGLDTLRYRFNSVEKIGDISAYDLDGVERELFSGGKLRNLEGYRYQSKLDSNKHLRFVRISDTRDIPSQTNMIITDSKYPARTAKGIRLGSMKTDVLAAYGYPTQTYYDCNKQQLIYFDFGIGFEFTKDVVTSWYIF